MRYGLILLSAVLIPLAGALLLPLVGWFSCRMRNFLAFALILASFILSLVMIPQVIAGRNIMLALHLPAGISFSLIADGLAVFMACVSSLVSTLIVLYSFGYISHYQNQNEYYSMVVLFLGAMMGLIFSGNLILLYIFWEITAITSWRLIGFFREKDYILRADKAFLVTVFGALLMLIGFISIYQQTGSFELLVIKQVLGNHPLSDTVVLLILIGIFSKSATLPFQTWLPDAAVAPSPVTALLHAAVLVKIGVYVFARLFVATFSYAAIWQTLVPAIAACSMLVSAGAALVDTDLKRIIAYSTISQIGFIFFGLSVGNGIALTGGLLYILMHGLSKAGLFLCAGIIEQNTKIKDITKLGGLIQTMPITAISFLFCAFSIMGIPPFGGFFSKYLIFSGAIAAGRFWISAVFLIGAVLTLLYLLRLFNLVFLGEAHSLLAKEGSRMMLICVAILAGLSLVSGIFIRYPAGFAQKSAAQMLAVAK